MGTYKCNLCNKCFTSKRNLIQHQNKKFKCNRINDKDVTVQYAEKNVASTFMCNVCNKQFKTIRDLERHTNRINKCKNIAVNDNVDNDIMNKLLNKINKLEQKITTLEQNNSTTNVMNNTINNTTNNTINITLQHGKENTDYITNEQYNYVFKKRQKSVPYYIKMKHFDKNNKQNNNVYISNLRDAYANVYDGEKWTIDNKNFVIDTLYLDNVEILMEKFEDMKEKEELTDKSIENFDEFIELREDEKTMGDVKNDIKKVLYNDRHIVISK